MSKKNLKIFLILFFIIIVIIASWFSFFRSELFNNQRDQGARDENMTDTINLPDPKKTSDNSLEELIKDRRSERSFSQDALEVEEVSQLLWSAQGITEEVNNLRAAPSAGALYPLDVYVVVSNCRGLDPGVYKYLPEKHSLKPVRTGDFSRPLAESALSQMFVAEAPLNLVISGDYSITKNRYGDRGEQYVHIEVGHVSQNIFLQAESLGLGTVPIGAFDEGDVMDILDLDSNKTPFYIMPIGKKH